MEPALGFGKALVLLQPIGDQQGRVEKQLPVVLAVGGGKFKINRILGVIDFGGDNISVWVEFTIKVNSVCLLSEKTTP